MAFEGIHPEKGFLMIPPWTGMTGAFWWERVQSYGIMTPYDDYL